MNASQSVVEPKVIALAKKGDPAAIAILMNSSLQPRGISATTFWRNGRLEILIEASSVPNPALITTFVRRGFESLNAELIKTVKLYARKLGDTEPAWQQELVFGTTHQTDIEHNNIEQHFEQDIALRIKLRTEGDVGAVPPERGSTVRLSAHVEAPAPHPNLNEYRNSSQENVEQDYLEQDYLEQDYLEQENLQENVEQSYLEQSHLQNHVAQNVEQHGFASELLEPEAILIDPPKPTLTIPSTASPMAMPAPLDADAQKMRFLRFQFGASDSALLPLIDIKEVLKISPDEIVPVPDMPPCIWGVYNCRGEMLWLVDLMAQLNVQPSSYTDHTWLNQKQGATLLTAIAIQVDSTSLAIVIPKLFDIELHSLADLQPATAQLFSPTLLPFIQGYFPHSQALVLNARALLQDSQFQVHSRSYL